MSDKPSNDPARATMKRRQVFVGAGTVGALAAAAAVLPGLQAEPEKVAAAASPQDAGYRLTEHIQRYYQTARV